MNIFHVGRLMALLHTLGYASSPYLVGASWDEQEAVIRRLLTEHQAEEIEEAIRGMRLLWQERLFSAQLVEKYFEEAVQMWRERGPGVARAPDDR